MRHHVGEQCIARNIERHAQENIRTSLIQLTRQPAIGYIELKEGVAGRQCHFRNLPHVPCAHNEPTRIGVAAQISHHFGNLVHHSIGVVWRWRRPRPPLPAIHRAQFAIGIGPLIPDTHPGLLKAADVGLATKEPEQLVNDALGVNLLGRYQWKTILQIEAHLPTKHRERARAGSIGFHGPVIDHMPH